MIITITLNAALDRTLYLKKPMALDEVNRAYDSRLEPGGKGISVSAAIKALGGDSVAIGFSAGANGRLLRDMLTAGSIHHDFVDVAGQTRMNIQIIDDEGGHTEVNEPGAPVSEADYLRLLDRMDGYLDRDNIFVLSGSTPPKFPVESYGRICAKIKARGCRLIVDASGELLSEALQHKPDVVKTGILDLFEAVGDFTASYNPEDVARAARLLREKGAGMVAVSMQHEGGVFVSANESEKLYVTTKSKIFSEGAVGTGDAFVGGIATALAGNYSFEKLARLAVSAGRASAKLPGTAMATLKRVYEVYETTEVYTI